MLDDNVKSYFNAQYPSVADLREKARRRIPGFAFEYLDGGCNSDENLHRNMSELQTIQLMPEYLALHDSANISTTLFGRLYAAPFGVAPVGLQGLIWPNSPEILARAATQQNIPFILSTVSTSDIERIGEITEGKAWFQVYYPAEKEILDDIIRRVDAAGYPVLVLLADAPTFGFRPRDIRNGLSLPPKMGLRNFLQIAGKPAWTMQTLRHGQPTFETLKPYMKGRMNLKQLGHFMDQTFDGKLNSRKIAEIRDLWPGKLVVKGIVNERDLEQCLQLGVDGIIVSNHGGRQLDAGESTIVPTQRLAKNYSDKLTIMMDGGLRSGPDVARALAAGAAFTFMGRPFMYGVGALGNEGGNHTISMLKIQFQQIMDQLGCGKVSDLPEHLVSESS